ncbi:MAG: hypothetical protein OEY13_12045 [Gammaproteobacteria bacterium]|nr:hypothetical protein [Gammaproteobacteria bacterium]MDH4310987.1 hypothetical protein [Gammaproteobacteria bacterium]MDH5273792.1 hypothetical protein [Gammaproteobacteria bacterium]
MRIELIMTALAGFAGGLAGTLWGGMVSAALLARRPELRAAGWRPDSGWRVLHTAALHGLCGAAAGLLFWLGWGLAAFTGTPWFVVGATYGVLLWFATALPALALLALRLPALRAAVVVMAVEALVATLSIGLLCAFVWHRAA